MRITRSGNFWIAFAAGRKRVPGRFRTRTQALIAHNTFVTNEREAYEKQEREKPPIVSVEWVEQLKLLAESND